MRWLIALLLSICSLVRDSALADEFPYRAAIKTADTQVRSGPGKNFYATDKLDEGATVEVYRHDPGGWAAIRPPDGSFSWVKARYLQQNETCPCVATVNSQGVVARVGSSVTEARDVIQVHLDHGEAVELVDGDEAKPGSWRKIAPPSGEFRWVPMDAIERSSEPALLADSEGDHHPFHQEPKDFQRAGFDEEADPTLTPPLDDSPPRRRRLSHAALQQEIVDIDLELSTRAAEDVTTWQFDDLHERAERALEGAPTALDRAAVREVMAKLDRFDKIFDGHADVQLAQSRVPRAEQLASEQADTPFAAIDGSRFDGVGRLAQVVSKQPNSPKYALVDPAGKVQYYLNPAPGVNLRPFLNKEVGVNGTRSAIAAKKRQVLSAQRITELPGKSSRF